MDYKNTLNLPRTDFAMKADLVAREPQRLAQWEKENLYGKIQDARKDAQKFVLHDGPPFANGDVHIGTALNKILKDIIIKYKTLRGFSSPYIPGWDCHGLPIEFKVTSEMRKAGDASADAATIRTACDAYARKFIDIQRGQFKRLGVLGDWENPYLTLNKEYEAAELGLFADIVAKGFVYRGKKPVYWSIPCRTALAEAEVEYADHISQSVYVKFPVVGQSNTFVLIWTTTPWTLPANLAVAYNKDLEYVRATHDKGGQKETTYILAKCRLDEMVLNGILPSVLSFEVFSTDQLLGLKYQHPFIPTRTSQAFAADFVTSDTGTGFVHIAPGHGLDDYNLGRKNRLPIYSPVDDDGRLCIVTPEEKTSPEEPTDLPVGQQMPAELVGKSILEKNGKSDANEAVLSLLRSQDRLLHQQDYRHSYPHCWRSKTPVIFRAMNQWFIGVDRVPNSKESHRASKLATFERPAAGDEFANKETLRIAALNSIERVEWIPDWGRSRIEGAIKSRPDWCISRQRTWGVPIPVFFGQNGEIILNPKLIDNFAAVVKQHGSNIWFEKSVAELWDMVRPDDWNGAAPIAKSQDTLDVWIDSGSSSRAVIEHRDEIRGKEKAFQADVYLEGSDQHRGWFQSSLLLSLAGNGAPPFKTVLTHGFMVDADREKISKSKQGQGGYEKPQTAEAYVKKYGADVVRLWVASQDYRSDIVVSEERINKVSETYRNIRNCLRYQLSNLYDFDPAKNTVTNDKLTGLDRWILGAFTKLEEEVLKAYDAYEFHVVYQKISQFIAVELSSIYHDVVKDRLYTDAANSNRRRSTQSALHRIVSGLCRMLSPILAFTADEAWEFVPGKTESSVHFSQIHPESLQLDAAEQVAWNNLFKVRELVLPSLELERQAKTIGKALEAKVEIEGGDEALRSIASYSDALRELSNVSQLTIRITDSKDISLAVKKADGQKCERCWHSETDVGSHAKHPGLCGRCVEAVASVLP